MLEFNNHDYFTGMITLHKIMPSLVDFASPHESKV